MDVVARPYHDATDVVLMRQLVIEGNHAAIPASYLHPGALDWELYRAPDQAAHQRNLQLWERVDDHSHSLEAWAMYSPHETTFDLFVSQRVYGTHVHQHIMDEYVVWATRRAHEVGLKQLAPFWMFEHDYVSDQLLREHGFERLPADPAPPLFERSLEQLPLVHLPAGFCVQAVQNHADARLRASVTYNAFRSGGDWEHYWQEYTQFMASDVYAGERDLLVRSPNGQGAAACTIWFDYYNAVGLFEPVATHPDFQRMGLGKAVMAEGLRRMQQAGMRRAVLGFDPTNLAAQALYSSLGFRASRYFALYSKTV